MASNNSRRRSRIPCQNALIWGIIFCIAINFYIATYFEEQKDNRLLGPASLRDSRFVDKSNSGGIGSDEGAGDTGSNGGSGIGGGNNNVDEYSKHEQEKGKSFLSNNIKSQFNQFLFDRKLAERALLAHGRDAIFQPLRAYVEKPLNDTVPGTVDKGNLGEKKPKKEVGRPAKFYVPLPLRAGSPDDLKMFEYGHRLKSCNDMPAKLPVDRGFGKHVVPNVQNKMTFASGKLDVWEEAKEGSPVNADPFLPWVHDAFPDANGSAIHFIAQNKRRCNSGRVHWEDFYELQPQVTILQPVSVQRIDETTARELAPELWSPNEDATQINASKVRYRLAPHDEADSDAMFTRFLCRFKAIDFTSSPPELINVGETFSTYPYNYEFVNYRKDIGDLSMLTPKGKDNPMFWLSQQSFDCPVPDNGDLRSVIASGDGVLSDGTPIIYVDVVPIRTAPRYGKGMSYFTPDMAGDKLEVSDDKFGYSDLMTNNIVHVGEKKVFNVGMKDGFDARFSWGDNVMKNGFDPRLFWGERHVLPQIEASGRWENFPICHHPWLPSGSEEAPKVDIGKGDVVKKHKLAACLWASASFTTRGNAQSVSDTTLRLVEWIEFHLMVGFDHIYVYDNTGAHAENLSLESTLFPRFTESEVTRIDWPSRVCNNNIPAHENTGERSSQYAAENSCRTRYGPYTEWMISFDTDEYLIPMGKYESMVDVVDDAAKSGTKILTFRSTRAPPIYSLMEPFHEHVDCGTASEPKCLSVKPGTLFAEAYNCDFEKPPKPSWADRAKKQLYRPDYVLMHYVHYSTVTRGLTQTKEEATKQHRKWYQQFHEYSPTDTTTDEINQAVMLHSKTTVPEYTTDWKNRCKAGFKPGHGENCRVGFPWPGNKVDGNESANPEGFAYNCFTNEKLSHFWIPKLRSALDQRNAKVAELSKR